MIDQSKLSLFKELFSQSESVLVVYSSDALRDHLFAATSIYKTLKTQTNKEVTLLSSESLSTIEKDIVFLDETKTEIGHRNLCISLDYLEGAVDKITSAIDENSKKLHLTIKPKKGMPPLEKENISYSYTGADADMVILVGVDDLESLEQIYFGYENLYNNAALVSINSYETSFGNLKLDILGSSSVCEYVAKILFGLEYDLDQEVATNLLAGIDEETENLESYLATADTFEIVSKLLRSGARRFVRKPQETPTKFEKQEVYSNENKGKKEKANDEDEVVIIEEQASHVNPSNKKRKGRPSGRKNKHKFQSKQPQSNKNNSTDNKPKPGDLNYNPSGLGPVNG